MRLSTRTRLIISNKIAIWKIEGCLFIGLRVGVVVPVKIGLGIVATGRE